MAICSFQTMSLCLTALSDNCIGIMVGDGERFDGRVIRSPSPNDVITPLYYPLICLAFPSFHLARIPKFAPINCPLTSLLSSPL